MKMAGEHLKVAVSLRTYGIVQRGAERYVGLVIDGLRKRGHRIDLFSEGSGQDIVTIRSYESWKNFLSLYGKIIDNSLLSNILYVKFGVTVQSSYIRNFLFQREFYKRLIYRRLNYDLIWQNDGILFGKWLINRFKRVRNIPIVITDHGGQSSALVHIRTRPDAIVYYTRFAMDKYCAKLKDIKATVIPGCVDIEVFYDKAPCKDLESCERPIVLSTSALIKEKSIDLLIQAMSKVPKGTLVLCGGGNMKDKLVEMGKNLLGDRFIYVGVLPYNKLISYYLACDVFCLPGREYFGLSMLEAMAANKPVVTWDDPTPKEIVKDAGILLNLKDIDKFSKAIWDAYKTDFGDKPRKYAERYSVEKTVNKYEQLFMELVSKYRRI